MLFRSNGLKAVDRIPKSDKTENVRRFKALEKDFNNKYFDNKNSNISRVCFESYDPDIYYNQMCEEFTGIGEDKGYSYVDKVPSCILRDEQRKIDIIMSWDWKDDFTEGSRNNYIFNLAGAFCEYGIDQGSAEGYILNNVVIGDFTESEALTAIRSAYRRRVFDSKYFEDYNKIEKVKKRVIRGEANEEIKRN